MYTRDLNGDWNDELIITWGGGSADRLEVLSVDSRSASIVLNQSYRVDASMIDLSGRGKVDIFIVTAESGATPSYCNSLRLARTRILSRWASEL